MQFEPVLAMLAAYERTIVGSRTWSALDARRARGEKIGGAPPFGYRHTPEGMLVPHDAEQQVITRVVQMHRDRLSVRAIADALNCDGTPARGSKWHRSGVSRILARAGVPKRRRWTSAVPAEKPKPKTHCAEGHALTGDNVWPGGRQFCRTCSRERADRARQHRNAKAAAARAAAKAA